MDRCDGIDDDSDDPVLLRLIRWLLVVALVSVVAAAVWLWMTYPIPMG